MYKEMARERDVLDSLATTTGTITSLSQVQQYPVITQRRENAPTFSLCATTFHSFDPFPIQLLSDVDFAVCLDVIVCTCTPTVRCNAHPHHLSSINTLRCYVWCSHVVSFICASANVPAPLEINPPIDNTCADAMNYVEWVSVILVHSRSFARPPPSPLQMCSRVVSLAHSLSGH